MASAKHDDAPSCPVAVKRTVLDDVLLKHAEALASSITESFNTTLRAPAFNQFVEQDLAYLMNYASWVSPGLTSGRCGGASRSCASTYSDSLRRSVTFDEAFETGYKNVFNVSRVEPNAALSAYGEFYASKQTCDEAVTSMMVCLCSYRLVAKRIHDLAQSNAFALWSPREVMQLEKFVEFNGKPALDGWTGHEEGSGCANGRAVLESLGVSSYDEALLETALRHEQALWSVPDVVEDL